MSNKNGKSLFLLWLLCGIAMFAMAIAANDWSMMYLFFGYSAMIGVVLALHHFTAFTMKMRMRGEKKRNENGDVGHI